MGNVVRVRIDVSPKEEDRDVAFRKMFTLFKKICADTGVIHTYKEHESFESKSRKKRRKSRESEIARMKAKLKENFLQGKKPHE
jgi:ribosomal protein S21